MSVATAPALGALAAALGGAEWRGAGGGGGGEARRLALGAARSLLRPAHPAARHLAHALLCGLAKTLVYDDGESLASS